MASEATRPDGSAPAPEQGHGWHRLHPTSLIFGMLGLGRALIIPAIAVLLFAREGRWEAWLMVLFIPAAIVQVIRYLTLRYRFGDDELVVRQGLLFRNERHIPFRRIQNIDLVQNVLHRAFRVADVRIETAGGGEPEAVLRVLSLTAVESMRARVFAERRGDDRAIEGAPTQHEGELLVHLKMMDLVKLGLITIRGLALVAILFGAIWEFGLWDAIEDRFEEWAAEVEQSIERAASQQDGDQPVHIDLPHMVDGDDERSIWSRLGVRWLVIGGLAAGIPVILILSIAWTILRLHDFRLVKVNDDLRWSCGLFTRRSATIPRRRIQFISIRQSVLHRIFRAVSISVETAAGAARGEGEDEDVALSQKWFVPLASRDDAMRIVRAVQPAIDFESAAWQPMTPQARRRMIRKSIIVSLVVGAIATAAWWPWGALSIVVLAPLFIWHAAASARFMAFARAPSAGAAVSGGGGMLFRSGVIRRKWSAAIERKMQVVSLHESPFDRRWKMASVFIDTAGAGPADHRIDLPYLDRSFAESLVSDLYGRSATSALQW